MTAIGVLGGGPVVIPRDSPVISIGNLYSDLTPAEVMSPRKVVKSREIFPENGRNIEGKDLIHKLSRYFG